MIHNSHCVTYPLENVHPSQTRVRRFLHTMELLLKLLVLETTKLYNPDSQIQSKLKTQQRLACRVSASGRIKHNSMQEPTTKGKDQTPLPGDPRTDKAPPTTNMITSTKPSSCIPIFTCKETERSPPNISQLSPDHPSEGGYVLKKSSKNSNDITMQNMSRRLKGTNYPTVYMSQLTLL